MNNQELIKKCRDRFDQEDEPDQGEWIWMVESLCDALEKMDNKLEKAVSILEKVNTEFESPEIDGVIESL